MIVTCHMIERVSAVWPGNRSLTAIAGKKRYDGILCLRRRRCEYARSTVRER